MWEISFSPWMFNAATSIVLWGIRILIHSTVILAIGLTVAFAVKRISPSAQSKVLRFFLAATFLCIFFSPHKSVSTFKGITIEIPKVFTPSDEKNTSHAVSSPIKKPLLQPFVPPADTHVHAQDTTSLKNRTKTATYDETPVARPFFFSESPRSIDTLLIPLDNGRKNEGNAVFYILFSFLWIGCSALLLFKINFSLHYLLHIKKVSVPATESIKIACARVAEELRMKAPPVFRTPKITSPFMAGYRNPAIFLPAEENFTGASINDILLHELAHIKRHDNIWKLVQHTLVALIPFQPLLWILSYWLEETSDFSCDDYVIKHTSSRYDYACGLCSLACQYNPVWQNTITGVGFLTFKLPMVRRIKRILDKQRIVRLDPGKKFFYGLSCLCIVSVFLAGMIGVREKAFVVVNRSLVVPVFSFMNNKPPVTPSFSEKEGVMAVNTHKFNSKPTKTDKTEKKIETVFDNGQTPDTSHDIIMRRSGSILSQSGSPSGKRDAVPVQSAEYDVEGNQDGIDGNVTSEDSLRTALEKNIEDSLNTASAARNASLFTTGMKENKIKMPVAKVVDMQISFDYKNFDFDLNNKDDRRLYNLYQSLDMNKNEPAWSPDGKWIAFTDHNRIWMVSSEGGEPQLIYEGTQYGYSVGNYQSLCFTADNHEITFKSDVYDVDRGSSIEIYDFSNAANDYSSSTGPVLNGYAVFRNPVQNIESVDIYSREHRIVVEEGKYGSWSHNGRYLCYLTWMSQADQDASLYGVPMLYDIQTGGKVRLSSDIGKQYGRPTFSPDDNHIVIPVRGNSGPIGLYKIPLDGGQPEQLTLFSANESHSKYCDFPEYSPDGNWILYTDFTWCENKPDKRLFVYNIRSRDIYEVFENSRYPQSFGKWSPDGKKICYLSERNDGNYIYICDFFPDALSEPVNTEKTAPIAFDLRANYPNPFNVSTTIEFSVPESGLVTLDVFNISGQKVVELVHNYISSGNHSIVWNGIDGNGNRVASGVYISRLRFKGRFLTNRMTLLK